MKIEERYMLILSVALSVVIIAFLPFAISGQDTQALWFPIFSEYLRGDEQYRNSEIIFGGQNLVSIYGDLPYWRFLRFIEIDIVRLNNFNYLIWVWLAFVPLLNVYRSIKEKSEASDICLILLYLILSPVFTNRLMAGHINLLFGLLPFIYYLSLLIRPNKFQVIFSALSIGLALSIQSYQLIIYHIFMIPFLVYFGVCYSKDIKRSFKICLTVTLAGVLIAVPNLIEMVGHAFDSNNARIVSDNVVYSYLTTSLKDLPNFIFSSFSNITISEGKFFFHEKNYAMSLFLILLIFNKRFPRKLKITILVTSIFFLLFCMNIFPGNLISKLPIISAFRVPQRVFMFYSLIVPILFLADRKYKFNIRDFVIITFVLILSFYLENIEILLILSFIVILGFMFLKKDYDIYEKIYVLLLTSLFMGSADKYAEIKFSNNEYMSMEKVLDPFIREVNEKNLKDKIFHMEVGRPVIVDSILKVNEIKTIEGYGHPPLRLLKKLEQMTNYKIPSTTNTFFFNKFTPKYNQILKSFNVDYVVSFDRDLVHKLELVEKRNIKEINQN